MSISWLGAATISAIRTAAQALLTDTCQVQEPGTRVDDGAGGYTVPYTTIATTMCFIEPESIRYMGRTAVRAERETSESRWSIYLPYGTVVHAQDHIVHVGSGITYRVTGELDDESAAPLHTVSAAEVSA